MTQKILRFASAVVFGGALGLCAAPAQGRPAGNYEIFVSNENAGTLTVINGADFKVEATIPVGKRPRGIHASPDGKTVYVALSGTPIEPPPQSRRQRQSDFSKGPR